MAEHQVEEVQYEMIAHDEADTERLARNLTVLMTPGTVIALDGDLGAGKTRFSQAVGKHLGVTAVVNSPTFTIIKEYEGSSLPFYHMDVYRISLEEAEELGLDEYFYGDGVTCVEWASVIAEIMPEQRLNIYIENSGGSVRKFRFVPRGEPYLEWCGNLKKNGVLL